MPAKQKVTDAQVRWAKKRYKRGVAERSYSAIARELKISRVHARDIVMGHKRAPPYSTATKGDGHG
jgi:hypothetical protein